MNLTKYQFDLLTYLEKKGQFELDRRELTDTLCISGKEIQKSIDFLLNSNFIDINNNHVIMTHTGYKVLEQYRVKKAVILAAGFGSRMMPATADRPKPMVKVNGKSIISTLLDAFVRVGINDITIVRGYKKEKMDELISDYPFIKFIDNLEYDKYNNISSAVLVQNDFTAGSYLCEADLYITNPDIITKYQYSSNILGSWSFETDDWSFKMDNKGNIQNYQKGNTFCWQYYGISYWTADDCARLNKDWKEVFATKEGKDVFWEQIPLQLKKNDYQVAIRPCKKQDIMEIDNYYELQQLDPSYLD